MVSDLALNDVEEEHSTAQETNVNDMDILEGLDLDKLFVDVPFQDGPLYEHHFTDQQEPETETAIGPWSSGVAAPLVWDAGGPQEIDPEQGIGLGVRCCNAASAELQIRCANRTAEPLPQPTSCDPQKVLIVAYATEHVHSFARYTLPLNANWARRFNHSFVIDTRERLA
eukprot:symbB.v1.2.012274.t1/scaffold845.1/size159878/4